MNNSYNKITGEAITPEEDYVKVSMKNQSKFTKYTDDLKTTKTHGQLKQEIITLLKTNTSEEIFARYKNYGFTYAEIEKLNNIAQGEKELAKYPDDTLARIKDNTETYLLTNFDKLLIGSYQNDEFANYIFSGNLWRTIAETFESYAENSTEHYSSEISAQAKIDILKGFKSYYEEYGNFNFHINEILEYFDKNLDYSPKNEEEEALPIPPLKGIIHRMIGTMIHSNIIDMEECYKYVEDAVGYHRLLDYMFEIFTQAKHYQFDYKKASDIITTHNKRTFIQTNRAICGCDFQPHAITDKYIPTFDPNLNKRIRGFDGNNVNLFCGLSGTGKTAWCVSEVCYLAKEHIASYYAILGNDQDLFEFQAKILANLSEKTYTEVSESETLQGNLIKMYEEELSYITIVHYESEEATIERIFEDFHTASEKRISQNKDKPVLLIIDYDDQIKPYDNTQPQHLIDKYNYNKAQQFSKAYKVGTVMIAQGTKSASSEIKSGKLDISQISGGRQKGDVSSNVLLAYRVNDEEVIDTRLKKTNIEVFKARTGDYSFGDTFAEYFFGNRYKYYLSANVGESAYDIIANNIANETIFEME